MSDKHRRYLPWRLLPGYESVWPEVIGRFPGIVHRRSVLLSANTKKTTCYRFSVCDDAGQEIAYALLETFIEEWLDVDESFSVTKSEVCLDKLWVHPKCRKAKLGRALVMAAEHTAVLLNFEAVLLMPVPYEDDSEELPREKLVSFYESCGYTDVGSNYWAKYLKAAR